jgi:AraC-like DNA-binding protein
VRDHGGSLVKKLRIAHARRLLDTTTASIAQVAELSGYRNMANFNRQFLAEVGATPTAYHRLESSQSLLPRCLASGSGRASAPAHTPDPGIAGWLVG